MDGISVIICCYNSSARIERTLEYLANQKVSSDLSWEIILVNNNSSDDTKRVATKSWENLNKLTQLIIIDEPIPGLSVARETGINNSNFDIIIYCDDDNCLFDNYIQKSFEVMCSNSKIAALGGQGFPHYEITPPDFIVSHVSQYATGPQADQSGDITLSKGYLYGAGIVIRKSYYNYIKENGFHFTLSGRKGAILTSGEDFEMCAAFILSGYKIWYESELKFYHYLPAERLNWNYLKKMNQGFGYSLAFLLPYITLTNMGNKISFRYSYYYFLAKYLSQLVSFSPIKFSKNTDKRLEWERTIYISISLIKNSSAIKKLIKELPEKEFVKAGKEISSRSK